ncbi:hypothetical protein OENI_110042 [Oenococcus oeni]|nr:hypothetical protein OENI_110042 [Oenococcus oeni]SYW14090.1 hypothetical protein OENI_340004 [Oenococcus oeni]
MKIVDALRQRKFVRTVYIGERSLILVCPIIPWFVITTG